MKMLTLKELQERSIDDFYMAIIIDKSQSFNIFNFISITIVMVKVGDRYQNLGDVNIDFTDESDILFMEPFGKYFNEGEYQFVMHNGRPAMDVNSLEPVSEFEKAYSEKMQIKLIPFSKD